MAASADINQFVAVLGWPGALLLLLLSALGTLAAVLYTVARARKTNAETRLLEQDLLERQRNLLRNPAPTLAEQQIVLASLRFDFLYATILQGLWLAAAILVWRGALALLSKTAYAVLGIPPSATDAILDYRLAAETRFGYELTSEASLLLQAFVTWEPVINQLGVSLFSLGFGIPIMLSIKRYLASQVSLAGGSKYV